MRNCVVLLLIVCVFLGCKNGSVVEEGPRSAVGGQQEDQAAAGSGRQAASDTLQKSADRGLATEDRGPTTETRGPKTADRGPKTEDRGPATADLSYIMGKFEPAEHPDFSLIDIQYADREGMYMRTEAYVDFIEMYEAALAEDIKLQIRSAARNFDYQKGIWERKWKGETKIENGKDASVVYPDPEKRARMILLYSSMPGTSRHHWGTDIDLNSFDNTWFESGEGGLLYNWMLKNASNYGFCQPYSDKKDGRTGYEEERWHWTYMPLSKPLTYQASQQLKNEMISGFLGSETASKVNMVSNYVLGINPDCN